MREEWSLVSRPAWKNRSRLYILYIGHKSNRLTALGINNSGELTMTYGYEDIDYKTKNDPSTGWAYNAATSTFFCRIRDLFVEELRDMFVKCESAGAWSAEGLINQFDNWQSEFPEELWRIDIERKYLRSYKEGSPRFLNTMMNGKKKYQRRQFERNQEKYMASKFFGNVAVSDQIMFRCNTPTGSDIAVKPDYTLHLTPYADMYLSVLFGATDRAQVRAEAGKQYDIECPFTTMDDTAVLVYCSSLIQSMGDISACYIHDNEFGNAKKLKELIIGNDTEGYQNSFITELNLGNNTLLEKLDVQNTPNLTEPLNLSNCGNLQELYAHGSGLTGVTFADGGMIEIAELPAINSVTMKNLVYLTDFDISSYNNLTTLVIENCDTVDIKTLFEQAPNINRVRITGVEWTLDDTSLLEKIYGMAGIDKSGFNISQSVLAGKVHVATIRQQLLYEYQKTWPDLEITFDTMIEQFAVTFKNYDGTVLEVQYVDKGEDATDPVENGRIDKPTKPSSVSTNYTYNGWDSTLTNIFAERIITAVYSESVRSYTVKYVSKGITLQESTGLYGDYIMYTGATPTYTLEEKGFKYYLFRDWDKSGYIDGNKTINAVFDEFVYTENCFADKSLNQLTPVELYALTKVPGQISTPDSIATVQTLMDIQDGDDYSFTVGYDVDYDDIESDVAISQKTTFDGTNYVKTDIKLFDEDKDFVLAIDYTMSSSTPANGVLAQCFDSSNNTGFKLYYNSGVKLAWGSKSNMTPSNANAREIIVLRHEKGSSDITVYRSNLDSTSIAVSTLTGTTSPIIDNDISGNLILGASRMSDGAYESYAIGDVHWCKVWYKDLGDAVCRKLVGWTHEKISFDVCGFKRFYLSDGSGQRCNFSLLAKHLLERYRSWNGSTTSSSSQSGGWAKSHLNSYLNTRLYNNVPVQIQQLLKKVVVWSTVGDASSELSSSDCYFTIPAAVEVSTASTYNTVPYTNEMAVNDGKTISFMTSDSARKRAKDGGDYYYYWLRSPNISYTYYVHNVDSNGSLSYYYSYSRPYSKLGVLLEISF